MISLNEQDALEFLKRNNIDNCKIIKVAGDASFRSYYRIFADNKKYILMFAPPSHEEILPFINIDKFLFENGFSAPQIFAVDEKFGFILLEDFGDDSYTKILARSENNRKELELEIYKLALDSLVELHKVNDLPDVQKYDEELLLREVMLFVDWYLPLKKISILDSQKEEFKQLWKKVFEQISKENQVLVLRDYHADNLMFLPQRTGFKKVGLLDFQDAVIGSKAYDLISLLEDARRDLDEENRQKLLDYYLEKSGCDKLSFMQDYEILSLQRNIKIVGIFSRLSMRDNKDNYLNYLPRIFNFIKSRLESNNSSLLEISHLLEKFI